jgi:F0F1-type ATP synthase assembly protein I
MATKPKRTLNAWAKSHSMHSAKTKLPFKMSIIVHEDVADFIHGTIIGLLIGFVVGIFILKTLM